VCVCVCGNMGSDLEDGTTTRFHLEIGVYAADGVICMVRFSEVGCTVQWSMAYTIYVA
jgi:hypothetical protein